MRRFFGLLGVALLVACQDSRTSDVPLLGPSFHISDGRFGGGNPEFFFASPLAATPQPGDPNFDVGASNALLSPRVRICETDGAPNSLGCVVDVTGQVTDFPSGLPMTYNAQTELYEVELRTGQLALNKDYRIEIWGAGFTTPAEKAALDPRWLFGWRDIRDHGIAADCDGPELFCLIDFGQLLPVRARIEEFVFCPLLKNCAVQFITPGVDANLEATLPAGSAAPSAQIFIPGQAGTGFSLAFEPCTTAEDAAVIAIIDIPTFGPCIKTVTTFTGQLLIPAIISLCDHLDTSGFGLPQIQLHQVALHHVSSNLTNIQALPEAHQCTTPTSGVARAAPNVWLQLAHAVGDRLANLFTPKPLFAVALDRGGGGESPFIFSFFKLALPAKFEYVVPGDANLSGVAGSKIVLRAKVTDYLGEPVKNARVRWKAIAPPGDGATVLGVVPPGNTLTNSLGIASKNVETSKTPGLNVFHAFGRGIADSRQSGCVIPPSTPAGCDGPRATFDPFFPIHVPEFDPSGTELPVELVTGTRLLFSVTGRPR
jgi:hypothetical protein